MKAAPWQEDSPETWSIFCDRSPAGYGGGVYSFVGNLMEVQGRFRTGLEQLTIEFAQQGRYPPYHAYGTAITDGSGGSRARWEDYLGSLPKRTFRSKKRALEFRLRGDPALDFCDCRYLTDVTRRHFYAAAKMVLCTLETLQATFRASEGCDLREMIAAAETVSRREWPSDEVLRIDLTRAYQLDRARIEAMNPWQKISMVGFHKDARKILDVPEDWSETDDSSPHGNDLGADVLGNWAKFKRMSVENIARWLELEYAEDPGMPFVQLHLAVAFGHVKKSGNCPPDVAKAAVRALDTCLSRAREDIVEEYRTLWLARMSRYRSILLSLSNATPAP